MKLLLCVDFYRALGVVSQTLQQVNIPFWQKTKAIEYFMVCLGEMVKGKPDQLKGNLTMYWNFTPTKQTCKNAFLLNSLLSVKTLL